MSTEKLLFVSLLGLIFSFSFSYVLFALVAWDINPANWNIWIRLIAVFVGFTWSAKVISDLNKKHRNGKA